MINILPGPGGSAVMVPGLFGGQGDLGGGSGGVDNSNNVMVYHSDGLGSVRALTNGSGTLVQTYQTDAFGNVTASQGTSSQPFGFTGQQVDGNGLVYLRARYYDPATGRFLSRDPMAGSSASPLSLNRYTYALNSPLLLTDPSGLTPSNQVLAQAVGLCESNGWNYCDSITPDMAEEMLHGNAREVDWTSPSVLNSGSPVDIGVFLLATVATGGDDAGVLIAGFTKHGINQVINRAVRPAAILDAVKNPLQVTTRVDQLGRAGTEYVGREVTVVLNAAREVVTAHGTHGRVARRLLRLLGGSQ